MDELRLKLAVLHNLAPVRLDYSKTIALLYALKAGAVTLDQVTLDGETWQLLNVTVEEPATGPAGPIPDAIP